MYYNNTKLPKLYSAGEGYYKKYVGSKDDWITLLEQMVAKVNRFHQ